VKKTRKMLLLLLLSIVSSGTPLFSSHYDTLGVSKDVSAANLTKAYRRLALTYHPDKNIGKDTSGMFKRINDAYTVLRDPAQRMQYDMQRSANMPSDLFDLFAAFADLSTMQRKNEQGMSKEEERRSRELKREMSTPGYWEKHAEEGRRQEAFLQKLRKEQEEQARYDDMTPQERAQAKRFYWKRTPSEERREGIYRKQQKAEKERLQKYVENSEKQDDFVKELKRQGIIVVEVVHHGPELEDISFVLRDEYGVLRDEYGRHRFKGFQNTRNIVKKRQEEKKIFRKKKVPKDPYYTFPRF